MDRRDKTVVDSVKVGRGGKFERIVDDDRIYLWTAGPQKWEMYWMQDLEKDGEDDLLVQVNQYLMNPAEAAPGGAAPAPDVTNNNAQVDALSNILENLGMPEGSEMPVPARSTAGTLTLADLQGAMAGLQTTPNAPAPLSEVLTPAAITSLLQDDAAKNRLLELLPEEQRSMEHLEDNLRSPQIQQTLRALSSALTPDETGSLEGYHSVIANFQLDPRDGEAALAAGNPIQAFLDCILASVQKEEETKEETNEDVMEE
jgi:26S proteasome regulatory subunit N13